MRKEGFSPTFMPDRPNILWICTDQQRYDTIGALGNPHARTPRLDDFIGRGVAFENAFCQSPVCAPSRASFLTGRYPRTTRCRQNGQSIPADEVLVSKTFADAGYRCGLAGKLHLASCSDGKVEARTHDGYHDFHWSHHPQPDWPENAYTIWLAEKGKSWEEVYGQNLTPYVIDGASPEYHQTTWCAEKTVEFIQANVGRPWFFSFNCFDPHHPFDPPAEFLRRYDTAGMPLPKVDPAEAERQTTFQQLDREWAHDNPGEFHSGAMGDEDHRLVYAAYLAMVELIDEAFGRILDALEETGQSENTFVVFMSDHGEMLGDHGIYFKGPHFYDCALRVPLVVRWPGGGVIENLRAGGLVELLDLAPTMLDAAGLEVPERVQGRSLMQVLRGEADPSRIRSRVYSEYYNAWTHKHAYGTMLRTESEKIIVYHGTDQGELYDLKADPDEFRNLWSEPHEEQRKLRLMKECFDASVLAMDPEPPRLGPF